MPVLLASIRFAEAGNSFRAAVQICVLQILVHPYHVPATGSSMFDIWTFPPRETEGYLRSYWTHLHCEMAIIVQS